MTTLKELKQLSDEELVNQIIATKNTALFGELYDRYSKVIYNKCLSFSKSEDEAQDLTQEVFLKLYMKLGTFQGKSKFFTWLYAFTYNFCVNYTNRDKAKKMERVSVPIETKEYLLEEEQDDSSFLQLKVEKLKVALDKVDPNDKMILLLKYQDEVSIKDLCELLEAKESAVKMRIKRAKERLVLMYNEIP